MFSSSFLIECCQTICRDSPGVNLFGTSSSDTGSFHVVFLSTVRIDFPTNGINFSDINRPRFRTVA